MLCLSRFVETKEQELSVFLIQGKCDQNKICIYSKHARNNQIIFWKLLFELILSYLFVKGYQINCFFIMVNICYTDWRY